MKLYVYSLSDNTHVAVIVGDSNTDCERVCAERFGDDYGSTYSPAFGSAGGLTEDSDAELLDAMSEKREV